MIYFHVDVYRYIYICMYTIYLHMYIYIYTSTIYVQVCMYIYNISSFIHMYIYIPIIFEYVYIYLCYHPSQILPFRSGRYVFGMFSLTTRSFCLLLYYCGGSILWISGSQGVLGPPWNQEPRTKRLHGKLWGNLSHLSSNPFQAMFKVSFRYLLVRPPLGKVCLK